MAHDLDEALEYLLEEEGGWSNHPADRGGATMYGVTQAVYDSWRKTKKLPTQTVRNITKKEARTIYEDLYWKTASCDKLPWPLSYITFDAAVNSGPVRAVQWLQAGIGTNADGKVGPKTIEAADRAVLAGDGKKILSVVDRRVQFLADLVRSKPSQAAFLLGWWRRTLRVLSRSLVS